MYILIAIQSQIYILYIVSSLYNRHYPCLWCLVTKQGMMIALSTRRHATKQSLESISASHRFFVVSGGNKKLLNCTTTIVFQCLCLTSL